MYDLEVKQKADKIFFKLGKKDPNRMQAINKKLNEICSNPFHEYKFLKKPLQKYNRVHIDKHFVIVFEVIKEENFIIFEDIDHHDNIYK